ncbi:hypothetical protein BH11PSE9_BH11PSE9_22480 [soil metagenome]
MNRPAFEPTELRRRAEAQIALGDLPSKVNLDPVRLLHELQVHKIELELQNEELISANRELDALRARFEALFRHAPVGYLTLSLDGVVLDANVRALDMLRLDTASLLDQPMRGCFAPESVAVFDELFAACTAEAGDVSADNLLLHRPRAVPIYAKAQCRYIDFDGLQPPIIVLAIMDVSALKYAMDDVVSSIQSAVNSIQRPR